MPLQPCWFATRRGNYIPLKVTKEGAVKAALEADGNVLIAAKAAKETTKWFVLIWTLNSVDLMKAWPTARYHGSGNGNPCNLNYSIGVRTCEESSGGALSMKTASASSIGYGRERKEQSRAEQSHASIGCVAIMKDGI